MKKTHFFTTLFHGFLAKKIIFRTILDMIVLYLSLALYTPVWDNSLFDMGHFISLPLA